MPSVESDLQVVVTPRAAMLACFLTAGMLRLTTRRLPILPKNLPLPAALMFRGAGGFTALWGVWQEHSAKKLCQSRCTPEIHGYKVRELVTDGPFAKTRNPMYTGMLATLLGLGVLDNTWWAFITGAPLATYLKCYVVPLEESYLSRHFPIAWSSYSSSVPRWM